MTIQARNAGAERGSHLRGPGAERAGGSLSAGMTLDKARYLQERVALFGKVFAVLTFFGLLIRSVTILLVGEHEAFTDVGFLLHSATAAVPAAIWLLCRTGARSESFCYAVDAVGVLTATLLLSFMGAALSRDVLSTQVQATPPPAALRLFLTVLVHQYFGLVVVFSITTMVVARSAIVPSSPWRTFWLSVFMGAIVVTIVTLGLAPLGSDLAPRTILAIGTAAYWALTIGLCTALSAVIHGLRLQAQEARQLGQYTLLDQLGEGGMGMVYRARHAMLRRPTAVKLLPPDKLGERTVARFEREVQLTAELTHPNTITIFDYGRTPDGVFYYAMELLEGVTLEQMVEIGGPQSASRTVHVLMMVAGALTEAHDRGLIHRDIKPSNIVLSERGGELDVATVLDFGLVKDIANEDAGVTHENVIAGTPMYMAPEVITAPNDSDGRTDLYALGCVAYCLVTGEAPFPSGTLVEICGHHLHTMPEAPSERLGAPVDASLEALIMRCLAKNPADRPASAADLREALRQCDVRPWSQHDARAWWDQFGDEAHQQRKALAAGNCTQTIAVDLKRRRRGTKRARS